MMYLRLAALIDHLQNPHMSTRHSSSGITGYGRWWWLEHVWCARCHEEEKKKMVFKETRGVLHTVALPFTLK
jgi:hypothetical protein